MELDFDFEVYVGVELDDLALPEEVQLDLELDFIVENRAQTEKLISYSF